MFRLSALRLPLSVLLLLLFGRVLAPEAWLLALHTHEHTRETPTQLAAAARKGQPLLTAKHKHCHVDQLYNVPTLRAGAVVVPEPKRQASFVALLIPRTQALPVVAGCDRAGRGPPRA
ncbi:hypothetical protein SAMN02745146_2812 [Hymenobacter daecheongensis DSM 21074]|uniref:Uncharacterized protein n=1 Tax=Hymenobacter daecheongensis DSM 21074 TaxID=1121955 RepID=A0A1M6I6I7_9BACT|nr:hypothetical protein SAMN02745146_2812 [Hymenobacter daecheongensis DSM 21074]